jgi:hypothetical protein
VWDRCRLTLGSIGWVGGGGRCSNGVVRRSCGSAAVGASAPAFSPAMLRNERLDRLQRGCGEVKEGSCGSESDPREELSFGEPMEGVVPLLCVKTGIAPEAKAWSWA